MSYKVYVFQQVRLDFWINERLPAALECWPRGRSSRRGQDEGLPRLRRPRGAGSGADLDRRRQRRNLLAHDRCIGARWRICRCSRRTRNADPGLELKPARIAAGQRRFGERLI